MVAIYRSMVVPLRYTSQRIEKLETSWDRSVDHVSFILYRACGSYMALISRWDLTFGFAVCSQVVKAGTIAAQKLNKYVKIAKKMKNVGLSFALLDGDSVQIFVFADSRFASNADMTSQLGFVIGLWDKNKEANIVHYSSFKAKRVDRSVLAAELFALVHAVDFASTFRRTTYDMFGRQVPMTVYTVSEFLYDPLKGVKCTVKSDRWLTWRCSARLVSYAR